MKIFSIEHLGHLKWDSSYPYVPTLTQFPTRITPVHMSIERSALFIISKKRKKEENSLVTIRYLKSLSRGKWVSESISCFRVTARIFFFSSKKKKRGNNTKLHPEKRVVLNNPVLPSFAGHLDHRFAYLSSRDSAVEAADKPFGEWGVGFDKARRS